MVQHRSRVAKDPTQPNLRGENITTKGIDLLKLPTDTQLHIGEAIIQVTGLRNPCAQLDNFRSGLMGAVLDRDDRGRLIRKAGIMGVVIASGVVNTGDRICVKLPERPYRSLKRV